jgi:hypothetical protein
MSQWQGAMPISITPIDDDPTSCYEAIEFFEACAAHASNDVTFEAAFPNVKIEEG